MKLHTPFTSVVQRPLVIAFFLLAANLIQAQNFLNPGLEAPGNTTGTAPPSWQNVPYSDPVCLASQAGGDSPDIYDVSGPFFTSGGFGTPYNGNTFVGGARSEPTNWAGYSFQEGIQQTVGGFTTGTTYIIDFYQCVIRLQNNPDPSGSWGVYMDNTLLGVTTPSTSTIGIHDGNLEWELRSVSFTTTSTTHTFKFLPIDDDNQNSSTGRLRMGIDYINIIGGCTPPVIDLGMDTILCDANSFELDATTPGVTYLWDDGSTNSTRQVNQTGTYKVTIDESGCKAEDSIMVTFSQSPILNLPDSLEECDGGQVSLDATTAGATSYTWNTNSSSASIAVNATGMYTVTATNGTCQSTDSTYVTFTSGFSIDLGSDTTLCDASSFILDATTSGASYQWNDLSTSPTLNVTSSGNYSVTVTQGSCTVIDDITVTFIDSPILNLPDSLEECDGEQVNLDATTAGATSYSWNTNSSSASIAVNTTGMYTVTATNGTCQSTDSTYMTFTSGFSIDLGSDTTLCDASSFILDATTSGASYQWNDLSTSPTLNVTSSGNYSVTVTQGSCTVIDDITVTFIDSPQLSLIDTTYGCSGELITLETPNISGATFNWSTGENGPSIQVGASGNYGLIAMLNGCTSFDTTHVAFGQPITVQIGPDDTTLCGAQSHILDTKLEGARHLWNTNETTSSIVVSNSGNYHVIAFQDACHDSDSILLSFRLNPDFELPEEMTACEGDVVAIDASTTNATSYLWNTSESTRNIQVATAGTYSVTVSNDLCIRTDSIQVRFEAPPIIDLGPDTSYCIGEEQLIINMEHLLSYDLIWNDGSTNSIFTVEAPGTYTLQAANEVCTNSDTIEIIALSAPTYLLPKDTVFCGQPIEISAGSNTNNYHWNTGALTSNILVDAPGIYSVTISNDACEIEDEVLVTLPESKELVIHGEESPCEDELHEITFISGYINTAWDNGSEAPTRSVVESGIYKVIGIDVCNQSHTAVIEISFQDCSVSIPNTFTPNGDGLNDTWNLAGMEKYPNAHISIYNRWGNLVAEYYNGYQSPWDGSKAGKPLPTATYYFVINKNHPDVESKNQQISGSVTIVR